MTNYFISPAQTTIWAHAARRDRFIKRKKISIIENLIDIMTPSWLRVKQMSYR